MENITFRSSNGRLRSKAYGVRRSSVPNRPKTKVHVGDYSTNSIGNAMYNRNAEPLIKMVEM